jgi:hypothetical protein
MLNDLDYGADQSEQDHEQQRGTVNTRISGTSTIVFQQKTLESGFLDQSDRSILQMQMMLDEIRSAKEAEAKETGVELRTTP